MRAALAVILLLGSYLSICSSRSSPTGSSVGTTCVTQAPILSYFGPLPLHGLFGLAKCYNPEIGDVFLWQHCTSWPTRHAADTSHALALSTVLCMLRTVMLTGCSARSTRMHLYLGSSCTCSRDKVAGGCRLTPATGRGCTSDSLRGAHLGKESLKSGRSCTPGHVSSVGVPSVRKILKISSISCCAPKLACLSARSDARTPFNILCHLQVHRTMHSLTGLCWRYFESGCNWELTC